MHLQWWRTASAAKTLTTQLSRKYYHTIQAIPREGKGPRISARDRAQGRIPAVVFTEQNQPQPSISNKQLLTTEKKQIQSLVKSIGPDYFCSTTFKLDIRAGSGSSQVLRSGNVLPIKLHKDEKTGEVMNVVLVWAEDGKPLEVNVPVVLKGQDVCPGLKKGGQLTLVRKSLKYLCPVESIPPKIEVDISNLDIGDRIWLKDIQVDPVLKLLSQNDLKPICKIMASDDETLRPPVEA